MDIGSEINAAAHKDCPSTTSKDILSGDICEWCLAI